MSRRMSHVSSLMTRRCRFTRHALPALAAAFLLCGPAGAQQSPDAAAIAELDAYIAGAARDWNIPGLAVAVVAGDSIVFAKGFGVREIGRPETVDADTRFAIGSTTKAMTVAALGMLVDEGKVRWDAPVITYLPHFRVADPYVTKELTVRDLLTHRGGLGNADLLWTDGELSTEEIVRRVATIRPAYSLRSDFIYQNVMYAVAGEVIEAVSGMSWADFLRTRIFRPLGMTQTVALLSELEGQPNVAAPHDRVEGKITVVPNRTVDPVAAAGSVWSSVGDMAKWTRFVLDSARVDGRRLLSEEVFREIMTPQTVAPAEMYTTMELVEPRFFTYGLGWFLHDYDGEEVVMHTGSIDGMSALIGLLPDRDVGVYVLANLDHAELRHALMYRVFDLYSGAPERDWSTDVRRLYADLAARADSARRQNEARRVEGTTPSVPLERYAGTYENATYGTIVVTEQDGALHLTFGRSRSGTLSHWHYDTFRADWDNERMSASTIVFTPDGTGGVSALRAFGNVFTKAR